MKWFKHDTDASIDAKLQELLLDYGAVGYGMYWYCVELIAKDVTTKNFTFELEHDARIIARNLNLSTKESIDIMKRMVELGLFDFSSNNKLRCIKLAYRLDDFTRKGVNTEEIIKNFKENQDLVGLSRTKSDKVPLDKNRIDKNRIDKNRIKEINKEKIPQKVQEWINYRKAIKKTLKEPTIKKLIYEYDKNPDEFALKVDHSIKQGYQGLFAPKDFQYKKTLDEKNEEFLQKVFGDSEVIDAETTDT